MWGLPQGMTSLYRELQDRTKNRSVTMRFKIQYILEIISRVWGGTYKIQGGFLEEAGFAFGLKG